MKSTTASQRYPTLNMMGGALFATLLLAVPGKMTAEPATEPAAPVPMMFAVPNIMLYGPSGLQSGNITIDYELGDAEADTLGLYCEYSIDDGTTWNAASVTGDTSDIALLGYIGSFTWVSNVDLIGQTESNVQVRVTPYDDTGNGAPYTVYMDVDNAAMTSVSAEGRSGYSTFRFWFNEAPTESTATNPANFTLSGGITPDTITVVGEWAAEQITVPSFKRDAGVGALNGKLYVVGGYTTNTSVYSNSMEIYDPATDTWTLGANMPTARRYPLVAGINGKLYVTGGYNGAGVAVTEIYDPVANSWSTSAAPTTPINHERIYFSGDVIDGRWYVNAQNGDIYVYDPQQDAWTMLSGKGLPNHRVSVAAINGKFYMAGGSSTPRNMCAVYNPATGITNYTLATLQTGRYNAPGGTIDGKFYVISGYYGDTTIEIYDPVTDTWRYGANTPAYDDENLGTTINDKIYFGRDVSPSGYIQITFDIYSWDKLDMTLQAGDRLPSAPNTVTLTANNQRDRAGNIVPSVETTFAPSSGNAPTIGLYHTEGSLKGDITVHHVIKDDENNPVWMLVEYSTDGGATWNPASVTGDTTDVQSANFEGDLVWHSGTDLSNESHENVRFRVKVRDHLSTWGGEDTAFIDVDNKAPASISVNGLSGSATFTYWFDEIVTEASATNLPNISLTGGTQTIASVATNEEWTSDAITVSAFKTDAGVGELDGKLYVAGGYFSGNLNTVQVYDPVSETWSNTAPMLSARRRPVVHGVDGKLYVIGGTGASGEVYDPATNSWSTIADAPYSIEYYYEFGDVIDGKIYLNTYDGGGHILVYDPNFDTWQNLTGGLARGGGTAVAIGGKLYITGGYSGGYKTDTVVYDPATGNLTPLAPMPTGRNDIVGGVIDGMFCVVGGYNSTDGNLDVVEIYNPDTNTWTTGDPAPHESAFQFGAVVRNRFYFGREVVNSSIFDVFSRDTYTATLAAGQGLPAPPTSLTLSATGIVDPLGHTSGVINTGFTSSVGNVASIDLYGPSGRRRGNIPVGHLIQDDENNSVWLKAEYSDDYGTSWYTATVTGAHDSLRGSGYDSTLVWHSATDLPSTDDIVHFRVTLQEDRSSSASAQPQWVDARAASGDTTMLFWFDQDVNDTTATDLANITLSGGLTISTIQVQSNWTTADSLPPARDEVAAVVIDGKIYAAGGNNGPTVLEIYDPDTDNWIGGASLPHDRWGAVAAQWNGKLVLVGGGNNVLIYDPRTDSWSDQGYGDHFHWGAGGIINGKFYYAAEYSMREYDLATGTERDVSGMPSGRWYAAYGIIEDKLYVAGGESQGDGWASNQLEIYDPATDNWSSGASMPVNLTHAAGAVLNGRLYVVGGYDSGVNSDQVYAYDPGSNTWSTEATLPFARYGSSAVTLRGKLHVMGGNNGSYLGRHDVWNPQAGYQASLSSGQKFRADTDITVTASNIKDLGGTPNPTPLQQTFTPQAWDPPTLIVDAKAGTHSGNITFPYRITDHDGNPTTLTCEYSTDGGSSWNPATTSGTITDLYPPAYLGSLIWQSGSDFPGQSVGEVFFRITPSDQILESGAPHTSIVAIDNQPPSAITATGLSGYDTVTFWFDEPVVDTTATNPGNISLSGLTIDNITIQKWQSGAQFPALKSGSASAQINGKLYVAGGDAGGNELHVFDPATDTWSLLTANNGWRDGGAAAVLNDRLYLIGSWNGMEYYDPGTDSWTWVAGDYGTDQSWAAFEEIGGFLYIAGGDRQDNTARKYNPATNTWTDFAAFPTPRQGVVSAVIDGKMYVVGGETGGQTTFYSTLEVYDPATDSWSTKASMPKALAYAAGDVVWGKLVVAGGFDGTDFNSDVYAYDPATDSWSTESTIPNLRWKTTASTIDNKLYIASGFHGGYIQALDIYDPRGEYTATLTSGEVLPAAETAVTITAANITDRYGNIQGLPLQSSFYPETGQVPTVDVSWPTGVQNGTITFNFEITDAEGNPVTLDIEYSTDNGSSWQTATTTGSITDLYPASYTGSFTWQSTADLADQEVNNLRLRITPSDNATTPGQVDVLIIDIDNRAPLWIEAQGVSGDTSFTFWFNEPVPESTAAAISNYSLSGGYGIDNISVNETWDRSHTLGITPFGGASVTELDGKLYVVGGFDGTNYYNRLEVFDPVTDTWTSLAPLPSPRAWSVVAGLNGKLYVLSGDNAGGRQITLFAYDTVFNTWNTLGAPPLMPAYWDAVARGIGGKLYVNQRGDPPDMYIYDPDTDSWTQTTGGLNVQYTATAVIDGKLYIAGGQYDGGGYSNELVVFDPVTGATTTLTPMSIPRHLAVGGAIDGKLYVAGGNNNSGDLSTVEIYDPVTDSWTTGPDTPVQRSDYMGDAVGSKLFHGRAINYQGTDYLVFDMLDRGVYDLTLSSGQKLPPPPNTITVTASNITDAVGNAITGTINTTLTASSGQAPGITIYGPAGIQGGDIPIDRIITDAEDNPVWLKAEYQLAGESTWNLATVQGDTADISPAEYTGTLTWQSATDLPGQIVNRVRLRVTPRDNETTWGTADTLNTNLDNQAPSQIIVEGPSGSSTLAFWFDEPVQEETAAIPGNIALSGGLTVDAITIAERWEYLATTAPTKRGYVGVGVMDGKLYVVGGQGDAGYYSTAEVYDPESDTWSSLPDMPTARHSPHVHAINGKLYVISGHDQNGWVDANEVYDPEMNSWTSLSAINLGAWWDMNGAVINGKLYMNTGDNPPQITVYDPHTDSWEHIEGGLPHGGVAAGAIDGKLYLAGGWHHNDQNNRADLVVFNPADNSTTGLAWMPTLRQSAIGAVIDGRFYVVNGNDDSGNLSLTQIYDPETNLWTPGSANIRSGTWAMGGVIDGELYFPFWDGDWTDNYTAFDVYSRDRYEITLGSGQTLPSPPGTVTITASNITDWYGNTIPASLEKTFTPSTGQPPAIAFYPSHEIPGGDVTIGYIISDGESNPVSLLAEYQLQGEATWQAATVQGNTSEIPSDQYNGSIVWNSATDLPGQVVYRIRFRITPRDNPASPGTADTMVVTLDNLPPTQITAEGASGDTTLAFWFNEPVTEATATDPANLSLSGGLTVAGITPAQQWTADAITAPSPHSSRGVGEMDGKLYVAGGRDGSNYRSEVEVYDPSDDSWSPLPNLPTPRIDPLVFSIGGRLYVYGGHDTSGWVPVIESYDPETGVWNSRSAPAWGNEGDASGRVINGKFYLNCGQEPARIVIYDPPTDTWTEVPGGLPHGHVGTGVIDGKLYIAGGWNHSGSYISNDLVVFDPATGNTDWLNGIPVERESAVSGVIDGKLYLAGGQRDSGSSFQLWIYNPTSNSWSLGAYVPRQGAWMSGTVVGGRLYYGYWNSDTDPTAFDIYDRHRFQLELNDGEYLPGPSDSTTVTASSITDLAGNTISADLDTFFIGSTGTDPSIALFPPAGIRGGDLTIGYHIEDNENNLVSLRAEYQLPDESTWNTASISATIIDIPSAQYEGNLLWQSRSDLADQVLNRVRFRLTPYDNESTDGTPGTVIVNIDNQAPATISADGASGDSTLTFWFNEPVTEASATNTGNIALSGGLTVNSIQVNEVWTIAQISLAANQSDAGIGVLDGKLYAVGGWDGTSYFSEIEVYDPASDTWSHASNMSIPRRNSIVTTLNGLLWVMGGEDEFNWLSSVEVYDPETDSWSSRNDANWGGPDWKFQAAVIGGRIYVYSEGGINIYDPDTDSWEWISGGIESPNDGAAIGVIDGKLYIAGGYNYNEDWHRSELQVFDPETQTSTSLTGMPNARSNASGAVIDGKFYVIGGHEYGNRYYETLVYDPGTDIWTYNSPPLSETGRTGLVLEGKIYIDRWENNHWAFDVYSRDSFTIQLDSGQTLPSPPNTVTITASSITDHYGNTAGGLSVDYTPSTGQSPSIDAYQPTGTQSGDITIPYVISDPESNPVWLLAEYQIPGTSTWVPATVTGDTTDIHSDNYSGSLIWNSGSDLFDTRHRQVRVRLTPRDNTTSWGSDYTVLIDLDNRAPVWISARAAVGESTIRVRFNEPVSENVASDPGIYSLSDGLTLDTVTLIDEWTGEAVYIPEHRWDPGIGVLNGKLYVIGGRDEFDNYHSTVQVYDPVNDSWSYAANYPFSIVDPVVGAINGKLYVFNGWDMNGWVGQWCVYDPETDTWTSTDDGQTIGTHYESRGGVINGKFYANDGWNPVRVFDPANTQWQHIPGGLTSFNTATAVIDDRLYIAGGEDQSTGETRSDLSVFDPATGNTTTLSSMMTPRHSTFSETLDGRFFILGGNDDQTSYRIVEYYDPATDAWAIGQSAPFGIAGGQSAVLDGKIYCFRSYDDGGGGHFSVFDIYERSTWEFTIGAGETLPFQQLTLQVSGIQDWEGNAATTLSVNFVPNDANDNPSLSMDAITDEVSGDIPFNYHISDTESDLIRLIPEFSIDQEATWLRATTGPDTLDISSSVYDGSLTWYSTTDLPGQDLQDVRFRLTPADNTVEIGEAGVLSLHVDNNEIPSVSITSSSYSSADTTWTIDYQLSDTESDTLSIYLSFSTDGGMTWLDASTTGAISNIGLDAYTGAIIWNVEKDLPGAVQDVLFIIDPSDNDNGHPDEIALRLNVYGVPAVDISTEISTEQDGDILFAYTITDGESDPVALQAEYFIPGDSWYPATVTDDRASDSVYDGSITWHTRTDLDGTDIDNITFRLTPADANTGFVDELTFHLDNNYPPYLTDTTVAAHYQHRDVTISYSLADAENDLLDLQCVYSTDGAVTWSDMTVSGNTSSIGAANYNGQITWQALDDLGYGEFVDVSIRVRPSDNDQGDPGSGASFTVQNYVGDYSADGSVTSADFATLVSAYNTQDTYHDIGPATGTVPLLIPTFDGVIDFEDLAVFIQMWNWSLGITTQAEAAGLLTRPEARGSGAGSAEHPVQLEERMPDDLWAPDTGVLEIDLRANRLPASMVVSIEIDYDAEHLEFLNLEPGPFMGKADGEGQTLLSLKNVDTERGRLSLLLGRIDREDPEVSGNGLLAGLQFKKLSKENSDITVAYELWNQSAEMTTQAVYETEVQLLRIPDNFELLQNYPNPFNGETMIRFKLPTEQRVQLYVYNIRGQRVATIIDEQMDAGYHRITWTGRNDDGRQVGSGVYIYLIQAGQHRQSKKLTYIK